MDCEDVKNEIINNNNNEKYIESFFKYIKS